MTEGRLDRSSPLFWLTLTAALGIIGLGGTFLIAPQVGAEGFGVPLQDGNGVLSPAPRASAISSRASRGSLFSSRAGGAQSPGSFSRPRSYRSQTASS
jgi:hypothetical protein